MHHVRNSGPCAEPVKGAAKAARRRIKVLCAYTKSNAQGNQMLRMELSDELRLLKSTRNSVKELERELDGLRLHEATGAYFERIYPPIKHQPYKTVWF